MLASARVSVLSLGAVCFGGVVFLTDLFQLWLWCGTANLSFFRKTTTALFIQEAEQMFSHPTCSPTANRTTSTSSPFSSTHLTPTHSHPFSTFTCHRYSHNLHSQLYKCKMSKKTNSQKTLTRRQTALTCSTHHAHSSTTEREGEGEVGQNHAADIFTRSGTVT